MKLLTKVLLLSENLALPSKRIGKNIHSFAKFYRTALDGRNSEISQKNKNFHFGMEKCLVSQIAMLALCPTKDYIAGKIRIKISY